MKIFAREFLWFISAVLLSLPIAYLFVQYMSLTPEKSVPTVDEQAFEIEIFFTGALIGFIFTYVMRLVMWAISKTLLNDENDS